jgi:hypothetical protein
MKIKVFTVCSGYDSQYIDAERIKLIEKAVEQATGMDMGAIMRPTHKWKEVTAKRVLFYLLDKAGMRYPDIAKHYKVNRATVWAGIRKANETLEFDKELIILVNKASGFIRQSSIV